MFDPDSFWEGSKGASAGGWAVPTGHTIQRFPKVEAAILVGQTIAGWSPSSGRGHGGQAKGRQLQAPSGSLWGPSSSPESEVGNTRAGGQGRGEPERLDTFQLGAMFLSRQAWSQTRGLSMPMF